MTHTLATPDIGTAKDMIEIDRPSLAVLVLAQIRLADSMVHMMDRLNKCQEDDNLLMASDHLAIDVDRVVAATTFLQDALREAAMQEQRLYGALGHNR